MHFAKLLTPGLLVIALLGGCDKKETAVATPNNNSTIKVSVSEAGAPPYDLNQARIVSSNYQTGAPSLTISGKLNSGKILILDFSKNSVTSAYATNDLAGTLDGTSGTNSVGTTTYNSQARTATGSFRATFPVVGEVTGSFSGIAVQ